MTSTIKDFKNRADSIIEIAGQSYADTKLLINLINYICIEFSAEVNCQFDSSKFCNSILQGITEKYGLIHFDDELISRLNGTRKMKYIYNK